MAKEYKCCICDRNKDEVKLYWMKDVVGGDDWNLWCNDCLKEKLQEIRNRHKTKLELDEIRLNEYG